MLFDAFRAPALRRRIIAALLASLALFGGCSALRLAYGQASELAYWWLDGYVDFDDAQKPRVRAALRETLDWHRRTQLADVVALLQRARTEVLEPVTAPQVCAWFDDVTQRADAAFEHALPAMAELVPTLSAAQIEHLERKYAKNEEKFADEYLQPDPARRLKAAVARSVDNAETLYGSLDRAQRERIAAELAQSPSDPQRAAIERRRLHRDIVDTLRRLTTEAATPAQVQVALRAIVQRARVSPDEDRRAYQQRVVQFNCAFAARFHNITRPDQRQTAAKKLKGWEDDLRSLLPTGAAAAAAASRDHGVMRVTTVWGVAPLSGKPFSAAVYIADSSELIDGEPPSLLARVS